MERFGEGSPGFSMISSQLFTVKITYFLEKEIIFDQFIQQHKLGKIREIQIGNRLETALSDIFRWEIQWLKRHHREFGDGYCHSGFQQALSKLGLFKMLSIHKLTAMVGIGIFVQK